MKSEFLSIEAIHARNLQMVKIMRDALEWDRWEKLEDKDEIYPWRVYTQGPFYPETTDIEFRCEVEEDIFVLALLENDNMYFLAYTESLEEFIQDAYDEEIGEDGRKPCGCPAGERCSTWCKPAKLEVHYYEPDDAPYPPLQKVECEKCGKVMKYVSDGVEPEKPVYWEVFACKCGHIERKPKLKPEYEEKLKLESEDES